MNPNGEKLKKFLEDADWRVISTNQHEARDLDVDELSFLVGVCVAIARQTAEEDKKKREE
jgi:hypothetical protein